MDIEYYMKLQNAYGTKSRREKELVKVNAAMSKHFEDTFDTVDVLVSGELMQLMVIRDTDGNTYKKKIKTRKSDRFKLGDYVEWDGQKWLITLLDPDTRTWNRGYMYLCTLPLRWVNNDGKIIERWAYSEDFTKYSNGISGNENVTTGDNQYGLLLPVDNETKKLKRDMRFAIDFDDSDDPDVYTLTNRKVKLNSYGYFGRGGTITLTMSFDAFNEEIDRKVEMNDGHEVWICGDAMKKINHNTSTLPGSISGFTASIHGPTTLRNSYTRNYTAYIIDATGNPVSMSSAGFTWNVLSEFAITQDISVDKIKLFVDDEGMIGSSFLLQIISGTYVVTEIPITITE